MNLVLLFGTSLVAGFLGTVVMTVGQEIQIRIAKRPISYTPALAFFKIFRLDFDALNSRAKGVASYAVHFVYGTVWGFPLAILYLVGFTDFISTLIVYFLIVWIQGFITVWLFRIAGPPWTWGLRANLMEFFFKALYATAGLSSFMILLELAIYG